MLPAGGGVVLEAAGVVVVVVEAVAAVLVLVGAEAIRASRALRARALWEEGREVRERGCRGDYWRKRGSGGKRKGKEKDERLTDAVQPPLELLQVQEGERRIPTRRLPKVERA